MTTPASQSDVETAVSNVESVKSFVSSLNDYIDFLEGEVEKAIAEAAVLIAHLPIRERKQRLAEIAAKSRAELRRNSDQKRWQAFLKPLQFHAEIARRTLALYPSPEAMLAAQGLGSEERREIEDGIQLLDAKSLLELSRLAVATRNWILGAGLLTINNRRPLDRGAFQSCEFASAIIGAEHSRLVASARYVSEALEASLERNRKFERGEASRHFRSSS